MSNDFVPYGPYSWVQSDNVGIAKYVKQTYDILTNRDLKITYPEKDKYDEHNFFYADGILVRICFEEEFEKICCERTGDFHEDVRGLASIKEREIHCRFGYLDYVLQNIGHEFGHFSGHILEKTAEEAKAYSYQFAWYKTIQEHNIGGLANVPMVLHHIRTGAHKIAFDFVSEKINSGYSAIDLFNDICGEKLKFGEGK